MPLHFRSPFWYEILSMPYIRNQNQSQVLWVCLLINHLLKQYTYILQLLMPLAKLINPTCLQGLYWHFRWPSFFIMEKCEVYLLNWKVIGLWQSNNCFQATNYHWIDTLISKQMKLIFAGSFPVPTIPYVIFAAKAVM